MSEWKDWLDLAIAVGVALLAALVIVVVTAVVGRVAARRRDWAKALIGRARHPFRLLILVAAIWIAVTAAWPAPRWSGMLHHLFLIATIAIGTWFVAALVSFALGLALTRYRIDMADNKVARRAQTQILIVRRLAVVVIVIVGVASVLMTFPEVQALGTSVLASAGILSVVAGLAAQSTLGNLIAGVQLAFSDAIRVQDVVIAEGQWGRIEEITLSYVVVHIWDDRRLVLPSTYFTTTPFENWTRNSSELLGSVELDLDWRVSPAAMRTQLDDILTRAKTWDGRTSVLQVTDATGGFVRVRILVSAGDAGKLFDLRCFVREEMVEWLHAKSPAALPRTRIQTVEQESRPRAHTEGKTEHGGLFTGNPDSEERGSHFTAAIPVIRDDER